MEGVNRHPLMQKSLGIKTDYDKWNDISEANSLKEFEITKNNLTQVKSIDVDKLDQATTLSYHLFIQNLEQEIADYKWRYHNYPVNQMYGLHTQIPAVLINQHSIDNITQAHDYIARLNGAKILLEQLTVQLKIRAEKGIIAPKFVFAHVINDCQNILMGAPFTTDKDSTLLSDFRQKINKLELTLAEKALLLDDAKAALNTSIKPGYEALISYLKVLEGQADDNAGAWKFPDGDAFYNNALKRTTTTDLSANEIHNIGLKEVERIHNEMRDIMKNVNFDGDLTQFFEFMRQAPQFYYANTEQGRQQYLTEATTLIDEMKTHLDELFLTKPNADLVVKKVEAFREQSAGKAFYEDPSADGTRPGFYYANLYKMDSMPTYQMAALAYHEGIPGHHMQIALQQEIENIPKFRKYGSYTAYVEGWGLYAEMLPKEIGFYRDPYADFGRLAMELWRACRLVVDTGIHNKHWTVAQGIAYYTTNTPNPKADAIKMVERHVVMPSQATAYKIGMLKIVELRHKAKQALGDRFDIRQFHDAILSNGALPLNVLETMVENYITSINNA